MSKNSHKLAGSDEKGQIFGLVCGVISFFGLIFSLIWDFGSDFGSLFSLIFGFGMIFGVISLIGLVERHYHPEFRNVPDDFSILPVEMR